MTIPYAMRNCRVVLGGIPIEGFSEDSDAFMPPAELEAYTVKVGADGRKLWVENAERGGELVIKLMHDSPSAPKLMRKIGQQRAFNLVSWDGHYENLTNGARIDFRTGLCTKYPLGETIGAGDIGSLSFTIDYQDIEYEPGGSP